MLCAIKELTQRDGSFEHISFEHLTTGFGYKLGDNCIQIFILGGISSDIRLEI